VRSRGCRTTYQSSTSATGLQSITTKDNSGNLYVLLANTSYSDYQVDVDLSALAGSETSTLWRQDTTHADDVDPAGAAVSAKQAMAMQSPTSPPTRATSRWPRRRSSRPASRASSG